ncbi:unnamed protein product, partial [marine sediment metagenome]
MYGVNHPPSAHYHSIISSANVSTVAAMATVCVTDHWIYSQRWRMAASKLSTIISVDPFGVARARAPQEATCEIVRDKRCAGTTMAQPLYDYSLLVVDTNDHIRSQPLQVNACVDIAISSNHLANQTFHRINPVGERHAHVYLGPCSMLGEADSIGSPPLEIFQVAATGHGLTATALAGTAVREVPRNRLLKC